MHTCNVTKKNRASNTTASSKKNPKEKKGKHSTASGKKNLKETNAGGRPGFRS